MKTFTTSTGAEYPMRCGNVITWTPTPRERGFILLRIYRELGHQLASATYLPFRKLP